MHVHLPKPLHGWREFLGEVGIVFLGVLIALGAEQVIETLRWSHKLSEVKQDLTAEMREDNGVIASGLLIRTRCADQVLDHVTAAIDRRADRREIAALTRRYPLLTGTFDSQAFTVAQSSEALLHGAEQELVAWGGAYGYLPVLNQAVMHENDAVAALQAWGDRPGQLGEAEENRAMEAIGSARGANRIIRKGAASLLTVLRDRFGIVPVRRDVEKLYGKYDHEYGDCAIDVPTTDLSQLRSEETSLISRNAGGVR